MKTKSLVFVAMIMIFATGVFAQPFGKGNMMNKGQKGNRFMNIPDLTDAQKTEIKKIRTAHMKDVLPLRNKMRELQAHKQTVSTGDNVNMTELNKTIDEIGALQVKMMKKKANHRQAVRKILTEDQRVFFDMHAGKKHRKGMMHGKRMGSGKGLKHGRNCNF